MSAPKYSNLWPTYAAQWDEMQRTRMIAEKEVAQKIFANKERYLGIEAATGVPWYWTGITHYRESDLDFDTQLAQGDPLHKVSTHDPAGMGPFATFEEGAIAGLKHDAIGPPLDHDVRLERLLYWWERWNGWGYANKGVPSAYVWAGSTIQRPGKWVRDHVWDPNYIDTQLGCAPIFKSLMELDPTIKPARETPMGVPAPQLPSEPTQEPSTMPTPAPVPIPAPSSDSPQLDPAAISALLNLAGQLLQKKLQEPPEKQADMTAALTAFIPWFISVLPQISLALAPVVQALVSSGIMGPVAGAGATPIGQTVGMTLLSTFGIGIANWVKTKWFTPPPQSEKKQ
jgi:lysozyme family protein